MDISPYRVQPDSTVDLSSWDTRGDDDLVKDDAKDETEILSKRLDELQEVLYAEEKHKVLVVLQATDTGGKDSTIRSVFGPLNPQGVVVTPFGKPTEAELAHDYLWRVHPHTPGSGMISVFNRSHYEDVLVVRVHGLVPEDRWRRRYEHIRNFEQLLVDEGTTIVKLYLHLSKQEQAERLQDRLDNPEKLWKFRLGDLEERKKWDDYQAAFTEMMERTSTADAPWYVVPADRKWFRNRVVHQIMVDTLEGLDMAYPEAEEDVTGVVVLER
ncbi:MAG: polyphosphate kinase 2 family protein [Acidimicrobiales bacterium]|nr:polyphosphate kinase 2 family protein [Acidimicrobiales bacterium]